MGDGLLVEALGQLDGGPRRRRLSSLPVQLIGPLEEGVYGVQALVHGEVGYLRGAPEGLHGGSRCVDPRLARVVRVEREPCVREDEPSVDRFVEVRVPGSLRLKVSLTESASLTHCLSNGLSTWYSRTRLPRGPR